MTQLAGAMTGVRSIVTVYALIITHVRTMATIGRETLLMPIGPKPTAGPRFLVKLFDGLDSFRSERATGGIAR